MRIRPRPGHSSGDVWAYWNPIYEGQPHLQGGYIWDWVDQGLRRPVPASRKIEHLDNPESIPLDPALDTFFAYGGTFGPPDVTSNGNFCANGLVNADRTPHPGLAEVEMKNWLDFLPAENWLVADWLVVAEGTVLQQGHVDGLTLAPRGFPCPYPRFLPHPAWSISSRSVSSLRTARPGPTPVMRSHGINSSFPSAHPPWW